ncbi:MAG: four helix bundle protein [Bacteroidia bacterium]|nr:four helix bundle protein [Bacteroidia bacterium]
MQDFKKLKVWEKAHQLTLNVYRVSQNFPKEETYNLTSQLRRSSTSVELNIVEGCGRQTVPDFKHFLVMAVGSANEVENCLILASDLNYIDSNAFKMIQEQAEEVRKMLFSLINKLK